jgi:hypothetical protein
MARFGPTGNSALLEHRGNLALNIGDVVGAVQLFAASAAQAQLEGSGWPRQSETASNVHRAHGLLGRRVAERAWAQGQRLSPHDLQRNVAAVLA